MKAKIGRRKFAKPVERTKLNVLAGVLNVAVIIIIIGGTWGVGYLVGYEALGYSRLTSLLLAPVFFVLLIIVLWFVKNF